MKRLIVLFVGLWLAFWVVGVLIHRACFGAETTHFGWVSLIGYDSEGYLNFFCNIRRLFSAMARHPLMNMVCLPVFIVCPTLADRVGLEAAKVGALGFFAAVGAAAGVLLWLTVRRLGANRCSAVVALCLWVSFAHVWLLGGLAESFGLSVAILLGVVWMVASGVSDWRAWAAMSILAGGVTVTNGIKPVLAWFLSVSKEFRAKLPVRRVALVGCGLFLLGLAVLSVKWIFFDGLGVLAGAGTLVQDVNACLPESTLTVSKRMWFVWHSVWCEPMMLHGSVVAADVIDAGYTTWFPYVAGTAILSLCIWSAVLNFRRPVVRVMLAMVACDFLLHVVIGWGIVEGQIYCGHWFWAIPILIALLPGRWSLAVVPFLPIVIAQNLSVALF